MDHALRQSVSTDPLPPKPQPQACHAPALPGPCCRAWLFHDSCWNCGGGAWNLEQSSDMEAGRQPGIHTRCTRCKRNAWHLRVLGKAQPPCPTSLLQPLVPFPLLIVPGTSADLLLNPKPPPFILFPDVGPPKTLLPAGFPETESVALILPFLDLRYTFSPNTW